MDHESNPYDLVCKKLLKLSSQIRDLSLHPHLKSQIEESMSQIVQIAKSAGGKLSVDVDTLASHMAHYLRKPTDPHLFQQIFEKILQIRQDATEI